VSVPTSWGVVPGSVVVILADGQGTPWLASVQNLLSTQLAGRPTSTGALHGSAEPPGRQCGGGGRPEPAA